MYKLNFILGICALEKSQHVYTGHYRGFQASPGVLGTPQIIGNSCPPNFSQLMEHRTKTTLGIAKLMNFNCIHMKSFSQLL